MAQGDAKLFEEFSLTLGNEGQDFANDVWKLALVSDTYAAVAASTLTPTLSDFTEVSGTGYTVGGATVGSLTWDEISGTSTFNGAIVSWAKNAAGPTDVRCAILYNTSNANAAALVVDITSDGTTAKSLQDGLISVDWHASGILTVAVT